MLEPLPVEAETSKQKYFMQFLEGDFSMSLLVFFSHFFFVVALRFCVLGPESESWPNWRAI